MGGKNIQKLISGGDAYWRLESMAAATSCYFEKVRKTMCTEIVSHFLKRTLKFGYSWKFPKSLNTLSPLYLYKTACTIKENYHHKVFTM